MKFIILVSIFLMSISSLAGAYPGYISCTNGTIFEVGDSLFQVEILEEGLLFSIYETSYSVDATDIVVVRPKVGVDAPNKLRILNKTVQMMSEGELFNSVVNALVIVSKDKKTATVDLSHDNGEMEVYKLKCVTVK